MDGQAWGEEDGGGHWRGDAASLLILYLSVCQQRAQLCLHPRKKLNIITSVL